MPECSLLEGKKNQDVADPDISITQTLRELPLPMFLEALGMLAARLLSPAIRCWLPLTVALISIRLLAQFGVCPCVTGHSVLERP